MIIRRMVAGFLAGASIVISLLAMLSLLFFIGGFWGLLRDIAFQAYGKVPFWQTLWQSMVLSLRALPGFFWSAQWGMAVMGLGGVVLAVVDAQRQRIQRPWRDQVGLAVTIAMVTAIVIGLLFADVDALHTLIADQPDLFSLQAVLLISDTALLIAGSLVALGIACIIWIAWDWWYDFWASKLQVSRPIALGAEPAPPDDYKWREHQERMLWLKLSKPEDERPVTSVPTITPASRAWIPTVLVGFVAMPLLVYLLLHEYQTVGPAVMSGEIWVTADSPQVAVLLSFNKMPRRLTFSNAGGFGAVEIRLSTPTERELVRRIDRLPLSGAAARYETADLEVRGLAPGKYRLDMILREGEGGLVRYVALYGGGPAAQLAAAAVGISVGVWLTLAAILLLELLIKGGWI